MKRLTRIKYNKLRRGLESDDASLRNETALEIADNRGEEAVPILATAIARTENIGANGTLVYALGHFDCRQYCELLITVALHHRFEASQEAMMILTEKDCDFLDDQLLTVKKELDAAGQGALLDYQQYALGRIRKHFFGRVSDSRSVSR